MSKIFLIIFSVIIVGCHSSRIANYKVTPEGYKVWRYTKPGETEKHILSTGDTLVVYTNRTGPIGMYIMQKSNE